MEPRKALKDVLLDWKSWGVDQVPRGAAAPATAPSQSPAGLDSLRAEVAACVKCRLHKTRTLTVFCSGNPSPLMFLGEAPGADEDAQGEVFVGAAGKLLTRVLREVGIARDRVYIANVLKCRPPGNRPPEPDEAAACAPYLKRQIELVNPKVLCALGKHAAASLMGWEGPMKGVRGVWQLREGRWVTATYHPSYLLRSPGDTDLVKADLRGVLAKLAELGVGL
ncbi:MAG: uracil-DNA glycosylase [Planctomycetes bacterium]|nr:uracil-DNA glycosylase [Planctomycetota bacterium]